MAMTPSDFLTWLRNMSRQQVEVVSLLVIYTVLWIGFIGPAIGNLTRFDTPMATTVGYSPTITLSVRTFLALFIWVVFLLIYIYVKPRLFGDDPAEYWGM